VCVSGYIMFFCTLISTGQTYECVLTLSFLYISVHVSLYCRPIVCNSLSQASVASAVFCWWRMNEQTVCLCVLQVFPTLCPHKDSNTTSRESLCVCMLRVFIEGMHVRNVCLEFIIHLCLHNVTQNESLCVCVCARVLIRMVCISLV